MWIVVVIIIILVVWIVLAILAKKFAGASSGAIFLAEASGALERGKSMQEAITAGLEQLTFYNHLTQDEILYLAESFAPLGDLKFINGVLVQAKRTHNINLLKDREAIDRMVAYCRTQTKP